MKRINYYLQKSLKIFVYANIMWHYAYTMMFGSERLNQTSLSLQSWVLLPVPWIFVDCWCCWGRLEVGVDGVPGVAGVGNQLKLFWDVMFRVFTNGGFFIEEEKAKPRRSVALVGLGGGYDIPRWLGDRSKLPEWLLLVPGTSNVLLL